MLGLSLNTHAAGWRETEKEREKEREISLVSAFVKGKYLDFLLWDSACEVLHNLI